MGKAGRCPTHAAMQEACGGAVDGVRWASFFFLLRSFAFPPFSLCSVHLPPFFFLCFPSSRTRHFPAQIAAALDLRPCAVPSTSAEPNRGRKGHRILCGSCCFRIAPHRAVSHFPPFPSPCLSLLPTSLPAPAQHRTPAISHRVRPSPFLSLFAQLFHFSRSLFLSFFVSHLSPTRFASVPHRLFSSCFRTHTYPFHCGPKSGAQQVRTAGGRPSLLAPPCGHHRFAPHSPLLFFSVRRLTPPTHPYPLFPTIPP